LNEKPVVDYANPQPKGGKPSWPVWVAAAVWMLLPLTGIAWFIWAAVRFLKGFSGIH
jgi:hypothetical protein